jgi:RNA polymerase sigma-70 factor (ECF subfamily)
MARVASGDHSAFRDLVVLHQDRVHALAFRFLGNRADAEELSQETFVRLYEAARRYRPEASFRTYLLRITTNLCINRGARAYRQREESREPEEMDAVESGSTAADPRAELMRQERANAVRDAVLALPADQRIALILFRFEELSYEEISELTGKSVSALTSLLWRARATLRSALEEWIEASSPQDPKGSAVRK